MRSSSGSGWSCCGRWRLGRRRRLGRGTRLRTGGVVGGEGGTSSTQRGRSRSRSRDLRERLEQAGGGGARMVAQLPRHDHAGDLGRCRRFARHPYHLNAGAQPDGVRKVVAVSTLGDRERSDPPSVDTAVPRDRGPPRGPLEGAPATEPCSRATATRRGRRCDALVPGGQRSVGSCPERRVRRPIIDRGDATLIVVVFILSIVVLTRCAVSSRSRATRSAASTPGSPRDSGSSAGPAELAFVAGGLRHHRRYGRRHPGHCTSAA